MKHQTPLMSFRTWGSRLSLRLSNLFKVGILSTALTLGAATAYAAGDQAAPEEEAQDESEPSEEKAEEIVITGTLIKRSNITTPVPTTILDEEAIVRSGEMSMVEVLNELPSMASGTSVQNTAYSFGNTGLSFANLRDLGEIRTLVLIDGRRPIATPNDANFFAFDWSNVPPHMVERIEIITGGASAAYGSDAIAGVINIITKKGFEGQQVHVQSGISDKGDAEEFSFGVSAGKNLFDDRGNATIHLSYYESKGLWTKDRDFSSTLRPYILNPDDTGVAGGGPPDPDDGIPDMIRSPDNVMPYNYLPRATLVEAGNGALIGTFDEDTKAFRDYSTGDAVVHDGYWIGADAPDVGKISELGRLVNPMRRYTINARYRHDLTNSVRFNVETTYALTESTSTIDSAFANGDIQRDVLLRENPFIDIYAPQLGAIMDANGLGFVKFVRHHREYGPRRTTAERHIMAAIAGLEWDIDDSWEWVTYYSAGGTSTVYTSFNDPMSARYLQAIDVIADPVTGAPVCRDQSNGCVPANVLGAGMVMDPKAVDFITSDHNTRTRAQQQILNTLVRGDTEKWFSLPAGPIGAALGLEWRQEKLNYRPSVNYTKSMGDAGYVFTPIEKEINMYEGFAEILIPILADMPAAKSVNLEAAFRFADHTYGGLNYSWKIGGDWAPVNDVRFRTIYAQAVRAPSMAELFIGQRAYSNVVDPCDERFISSDPDRIANCAALGVPEGYRRSTNMPVFLRGDDKLNEETAKTWTLGMVFTPTFLPSLSLAVDYWNIVVDDGISTFGAQETADYCVDRTMSVEDNEFCDKVDRDSTGAITEIRNFFLNADRFEVEGIDFELAYTLNLGDMLDLPEQFGVRLGTFWTYLMKWDYFIKSKPEDLVENPDDMKNPGAGEIGDPKLKGKISATVFYGPAALNWEVNYIGKQDIDLERPKEFRDPFSVQQIFYHSINFSYLLEDFPNEDQNLMFNAGVNNLFDTPPPPHPNVSRTGGGYTFYDVLGRYIYAGATIRF